MDGWVIVGSGIIELYSKHANEQDALKEIGKFVGGIK